MFGKCIPNRDELTFPVGPSLSSIPGLIAVAPPAQPSIELSDGSLFYPLTQKEFTIHTIAHSGAMACRFGGQCREFFSVCQHEVLVSYIMEHQGGQPMEGLLHDASESFVLDMATPIKRILPDYTNLENSLLKRIRGYYGLPLDKTDACDRADKIALFLEAYELLPSQGTTLSDTLKLRDLAFDLRPKFAHLLTPLDWRAAKYQFLKRYKELTSGTSNR